MKLFFALATLLFAGFVVAAQEDSTHYVNGLPVSEDDTARAIPDRPPLDRRVAVDPSALPKALLSLLDKKDIYRGWREDSVFFDNNTGLYTIRVREKNSVRVYGMDKEGRPVTYDEYREPEQ